MKSRLKISILVLAVVILSFCIMIGTGKINFLKLGSEDINKKIDEKVVEVGQKGYISGVQVMQTKTGTGPWDTDDNPGNDTSADNNIVRSYDQVTWTIDVTMSLKSGVSEAGLTGGRINIDVSVPDTLANLVKWDLTSMTWIENGEVSEDGTRLTGSYTMSESIQNVPGKQTLVFVLTVGGVANETEIKPTFTLDLEGNNENEKASTVASPVKVSSFPKYDISIDNLNMTYDIERNGKYQKLYKYGLSFKLLGDSVSKGLKGVEIPKDSLSFDIKYKMQRKPLEGGNYTDITQNLGLYNYKYNAYDEKGLGDPENIVSDLLENFLVSAGSYPYSSGGDSRNTVYKNGNLTMIDDNNGTIHVTITDFGIGDTFPVSTDWEMYNMTPEKGYVSVGLFYMAVDMNEETMLENTQSYMEYKAENFKAITVGNDTCTTEVRTDNNSITENFIAEGEGEFGKETYYTQNKADLGYPAGNGNGKAYIGAERLEVSSRITNAMTNPKTYWIYDIDILTKIDDKNMEPTLRNGEESLNNGIFGTTDMTFNVLYGAKKDKSGWVSDEEMIETTMDDLIYFDTLEELKQAGYTCVATLAESQSGTIKSGIELWHRIPIKIKDSAKIGTVAQSLTDVRIYTEDNQLDRSVQTHLRTTNPDDYPEPTWKQENLPYVKTAYDENGQMIVGTHGGSFPYGNSLLILGAEQILSIESLDESNNEKYNFDIGKNENVVKYEIKPEISNPSSSVSSGTTTIKIEANLPKGIEYVVGSSEYEEPEIIYNDDDTTLLTWYIDNCRINEDITPIRFKANIDNDSENGQSYDISAVMSEVIKEDGVTIIGNSEVEDRTAENYITITNLESHRAYKEVENPIIEENGDIKYKIVYENKTDGAVSAFQLLDILPYNGDNRGTSFSGSYKITSIDVVQTVNGVQQSNNNLKLYTTNSENVRNMDATNSGIGTDNIWTLETIGASINKEATGIALKGNLGGKTKVELNITLTTSGNKSEDVYRNNAMVQVYTDSEQVETGRVETSVINRSISGTVWEDENKNGIIDDSERKIQGITLKLINSGNNSEIATTSTDSNGEYKFEELKKGNYKVKIEYGSDYYLTEKLVGDNDEINSKFNVDTNMTDEITKLNNNILMNIHEENVNAGLIGATFDITTEVDGQGGSITGQNDEVYETVNKGGTSIKDIIATPDYGYRVSYIEVNGEEIEFTENEDHTVELNKFVNVLENKHIIVRFERIEGKVIVHHYIENTTTKVPSTQEGQVVEDVVIINYVGEEYTTEVAENVDKAYEYVSTSGETTGGITEETKEVIYYYKLKEATIDSNITKETEVKEIATSSQEVPYEITYTASITDYRGNGTVTIVDYLPYEIDEEKSTLDGGVYDKQKKTIIWTENIDGIDTYTNGQKQISITKNITLVYSNIDASQNSLSNRVEGKLELKTPEKTETVEDEIETPITVPGKVIAKYLEEGSNKVLADEEKITGRVGTTYETVQKEIVGYDFVRAEGNTTGEITEETIEVIYYYELQNVNITENTIEKDGTTSIDERTDKVSYNIVYEATIETYRGEAELYLEDKLPYEIDEEISNLDGGTYNEETKTLKWYVELGEIDTLKTGENVPENIRVEKNIEVLYKDIDVYQDNMVNEIKGVLYLPAQDQTKEVNDDHTTDINVKGNVEVKYVDKYTSEEIEIKVTKTGKVGTEFDVSEDKKDIEGYTLVEEPDPKTGIYTESTQEKIYYYAKNTHVHVEYLDERTNEEIASDETISGYEGKQYVTEQKEIDGYDFSSATNNTSGNMTEEAIEVKYYYKKKSSVLVHFYEENTENKLAEDITINGHVGEKYITEESEMIPPEYELVAEPQNKEGTYEEEQIVVIYYYRIKKAEIPENVLNKTGTDVVTSINDTVTYSINYKARVKDYIGNATLTITDKLPYEINQDKSDIKNGTYNRENKTITWNIDIGEINTYEDGDKIIDETIEIEVLFENVDTLQDSFTNEAEGKLYLEAQDKTITDKDDHITTTNINGKVIVKYVDKYTNEEISNEAEKIGKLGSSFDVSEDKKEIEGYTLVEEPEIKTGTYKEEVQEKIYYYAKNTSVHVTYVDKITNQEIEKDETINGYENLQYETDKKEIENYTYVEDTGNTEGIMTRDKIEVVYYYLYNTQVRVEHIDKITNDLLDTEIIKGLEGDECVTSEKYFEGYVLVDEPEEKTVIMTKEEIVVKYYYAHTSAGVVERHIDDISKEVLEENLHKGKEGDKYSTKEKEFEGYDLVEEKYPENSSGTMTKELIEVNYYYIKRTNVRVQYIDKISGEKLTEDVIINGYENDPYETEQKEFDNYKLEEVPSNSTGNMAKDEIVVTYYYVHSSAGVVEKHIDDITGEVLAEETYEGLEGDLYETKEKEFEGYDLVKEKYPENSSGTMTKELIEVNYYYIKKATVRVEYLDKFSGDKLQEDIIISGHENDKYSTEQKDFEEYDFIEVVGEKDGTMVPGEEIVITYYYLKPATVITRYLEEETEAVLAEEEKTVGYEGDEYVTTAKEIEFYKISKLPENSTGIMKDTTYVTYYYKKKTVDFSIDKKIGRIEIDGKKQRITNEDLVKAEVYRKSINSTDIKVVFNIKVTNEGEIAGKVDILEKIPEYLSMSEKDNPGWTVEGEEARYETETIEAGKSKTYKVVMTWKKGDGHFGMQKNIAKIEKVITPSGFDEENLQNNSDESEVMITISTGVEKVSGIVLIALIYMLAIIYMNRKLTFAKVEVEDDKKEK